MKKVKILLAEDHDIVRKGVRLLLEDEPDMVVVGEADDGQEAIEKVAALNPDVILMDIGMPGINGLEATRQIKKDFPDVQIVVLTVHDSEDYFFRLISAGASGYVLKGGEPEGLFQAIRAASNREIFLNPSLTRRLVDDYLRRLKTGEARDSYERLTDREKDILQLIAQGKTNQEIARLLVLSLSTVNTHRQHIMEKLELNRRVDLIKYALRKGLIPVET